MSRKDEARLSSLLELLAAQEAETGRQVLGWFASHPREELVLTREEEEFHQRRFAGKIALIAKPDQFGALEIAVLAGVRSNVCEPRLMEPVFAVDPLPIVRRESGKRRRVETAQVPSAAKGLLPAVESAVRSTQLRTWWRSTVIVATALFGAALVSVLAAHTFRSQAPISKLPEASPIEMLSLHAMHRPGRLVVSWNGSAAPIRYASRVTLVLHDGKTTTRRVLSRADARAGIQFFNQTSPQVGASLVLETPNGAVFTEDTQVVDAGAVPPRATRVTPDMLPPAGGRAEKF